MRTNHTYTKPTIKMKRLKFMMLYQSGFENEDSLIAFHSCGGCCTAGSPNFCCGYGYSLCLCSPLDDSCVGS